jgi:uncharacterized membrane protein
MNFNLIQWLFTDPCSATNCVASTATSPGVPAEVFHYYAPWIIFCILGVLIPFYYSVEGRKRFVKDKPVIKNMLDRFLGWLAIICILGFPLIFARAYLYEYFFAWRFWRFLWLAGLLAWAIIWIVYLIRKFPKEQANYESYKKREQYTPKGSKSKNSRRKATSSR